MTDRMGFGIFMAPFHRVGENPTLALRRDIELIARLDELGYDEAWIGEHHSGGWEIIASPELFLAAAGERTQRIKLGTGVVSLPYHHPFHVADRIVLLDHLTHGRAMLGVGPGALAADAHFIGIDALRQREMMDEALGVILRLLGDEGPITYKSDWFEMQDASLQLKPVQRPLPVAVAASVSPSGMTAAGKHGVGVLSLASYLEEGLTGVRTHWNYAETAAREHNQKPPDRATWRLVLPIYVAETKEKAFDDVADGILLWYKAYIVNTLGLPNPPPAQTGRDLLERMVEYGGAIVGSPDEAIAHIRRLQEVSGGFGTLLGLAHEWTSRENTLHSYELFARYVMPEFQDSITWNRRSEAWTEANKEPLMAGRQKAIMKAIGDHKATHPDTPDVPASGARVGPPGTPAPSETPQPAG
jgi:limonene 1,2-monooxygenase